MKNLLMVLLFTGFISTANAAFTRDAANNFASDDATGLDWLALSETAGQVYSAAETVNTGWRYATNTEMDGMFAALFPGYAGENGSGYSNGYATITAEVDNFQSLFGYTYTYNPYPTSTNFFTYGLYADESNTLRMRGAFQNISSYSTVYGNYAGNYDNLRDTANDAFGIYMVRNTASTSVPESASIYLLAFGLLGLFSMARRKA